MLNLLTGSSAALWCTLAFPNFVQAFSAGLPSIPGSTTTPLPLPSRASSIGFAANAINAGDERLRRVPAGDGIALRRTRTSIRPLRTTLDAGSARFSAVGVNSTLAAQGTHTEPSALTSDLEGVVNVVSGGGTAGGVEGFPSLRADQRVDARSHSGGSDARKGPKEQNPLKTLWEFSRPHTMIGTALAIPAMAVFAAPTGIFPGRRVLMSTIWAMIPSLLINIYITGLNQITDVEIDKINKPYLPIPAGNLSPTAARWTVGICATVGLIMGLWPSSLGSPGLVLTVVLSVLIGTSYSLPPLRLKRFPQIAALCILVVRGSIINAGFYAHAQATAYDLPGQNSALTALLLPFRDVKCGLALAYFTAFAVVIALMKDVPDVAGDRKFNIPSFSVVLGEARLFSFAKRLLMLLLYGTAGALGFASRAAALSSLPRVACFRGAAALAALASGISTRRRAMKVDPTEPKQVYGFYMFLWKIFYASYLFLPLAR